MQINMGNHLRGLADAYYEISRPSRPQNAGGTKAKDPEQLPRVLR